MIQLIVNKDILKSEHKWLKRDFKKGETLYLYSGSTYECIGKEGLACSIDGKPPFFEIPKSCLDMVIKMEANTTFMERAIFGMELLSKQEPVTLEEARAQVQRIKDWSNSQNKKDR